MATTSPNRVGRVRERLAALLEEAIPTATFDPADLDSQIPIYANPKWDCCSWYGDGKDRETGLGVHVSSWNTMTECVRRGITVSQDPHHPSRFAWDVYAN